jgi:hypothetical protein
LNTPTFTALVAMIAAWCCNTPLYGQVNVLTYHNDTSRTGQNLSENILAPANVNPNTFGQLFSYSIDGKAYAQPLYISGLNFPGLGTHNVVFVATEHNTVYAFDADNNAGATGGLLWQTNLGPSAVTPNNDFGNRYGSYSDLVPEVGITSTPVIDPVSGTLYVDAFTHEGTNYYHRIHALNITNGTEQPFGPVQVTAAVAGQGADAVNGVVTFNAMQQLQRSALTLVGGILYVAYAGYADTDPYHGWVIGFNASTLQPLTNYVFNDTPNSDIADFGPNAGEGGIWMSGNGLAVDAQTNLYLISGNGSFNNTNGLSGTEFGDSIIKFSASNGLAVVDYFTPYNQDYLAANDLDLGSGGAVLLPDSVGSLAHPHLLVSCSKEGSIYLLDRDNLGQFNSIDNSQIVQELPFAINGTWSSAAYFNNRIYLLGSGDAGSFGPLTIFSITNGLLANAPDSQSLDAYGFPGATPSISASGTNNAIVWFLQTDGYMGTPATLHAFDAYDLTQEFYNSDQSGTRDQPGVAVKFTVPTIANGKVYVGSYYELSVYGLLDPYLNWKYAHFGSNATNPAVAGDFEDPDGDGVPNLLEYALANDPNVPNTTQSLDGMVSSNHFQLEFRRNTTATDLTYTVQAAATVDGPWIDLMTYTAAAGWVADTAGATASESVPENVPPDQYVIATITDPAVVGTLGSGSRFYRFSAHR